MSHPELTIGIVIPTYNRPQMAVEAVRSACSQQPRPHQIVVVDDGSSTPMDPALIELAERGEIQLIREGNRGLPGARNRGASELVTDLVLFLDDDDRLVAGALAGLREALNANPHAVAAVGGGRRHFTQEDRIGEMEWPRVTTGSFYELLNGNPFFVGAILIRRAAFEAVGGFEEQVRLAEDWDLWLRLSKAGPYALPRVDAVRYGVHGNNMSSTGKVQALAMTLVDHYTKTFSPAERRRYGPALAKYMVETYADSSLWRLRRSIRHGQLSDIVAQFSLAIRLLKLALHYHAGRAALRLAWGQHLHPTPEISAHHG